MQFSIVLALLASSSMAHTPSQVKEELDAHPWRPDPTQVVVGNQTTNGTIAKSPAAPGQFTPAPGVVTATPVGEVWQLQIAALSSLDAAKAEQKRVEKMVGSGKVEILTEGSVNRVRLGSYPTKEAAEAARDELRPKGIEGFPVRKP
jgi:cell division septation protein DedD